MAVLYVNYETIAIVNIDNRETFETTRFTKKFFSIAFSPYIWYFATVNKTV